MFMVHGSISKTFLLPLLVSSIMAIMFGSVGSKRSKFCKLDNLIECFAEPNMYFTAQSGGSGIPRNQEDFEQFCFNQHDYGPYCARVWLNRCANPVHLSLANRIYLDPLQSDIREFCDPQKPIRSKFLEMAPCLIDKVKLSEEYRMTCVRDLQASSEWIQQNAKQDGNFTRFLRNTCCSYNQWEQCILDHLKRKCGSDASEVFPYLIHFNSINLLPTICPSIAFDPKNPNQCNPDEFQAPADLVPKGWLSNSLLSYFFSYYCPNVGFGIDVQHDS